MPMKKDIDIQKTIYNAYIMINEDRVYKLTKNKIYVESYLDMPSISVEVFWRDYAYSGEADGWFPHIDSGSIVYKASPGQYNVGTDIRAYGLLKDPPKDLIKEIREELSDRKNARVHNTEINKKIQELEKSKIEIASQLYFSY